MSNLRLPMDIYAADDPDFPPSIISPSLIATTGFGQDAEYDVSGWSTDDMLRNGHLLDYPPPAQPSLHFAHHQLAQVNMQYPPPQLPPHRPLTDAMNLPHGALPSLHTHTSPAKPATKQGRQPGERPETAKPGRPVINGEGLLQLGRAIVTLQPFLAPQVGKAWKAVKEHLREKGFPFDVQPTTLQSKGKALVAYKKNHECDEAKSVASFLQRDDVRIPMGAILEQIETQWEEAQGKSDEAKDKTKKKNEDNREAGEHIRRAATRGRGRKHARSPTPADSDSSNTSPSASPTAEDSDGEPQSKRRRLSTSPSPSLADVSPAPKKKSQRRRDMDRRTGNTPAKSADILEFLKQESSERQQRDKEMAENMKTFVDDARERGKAVVNLLEHLVKKD
ncbi:hypothetical protein C8R46DRAFT_1217184 [Mycena filopes]|nr:hypothetical protein C8R46DRAFT_1217184 [Mycena filopes]